LYDSGCVTVIWRFGGGLNLKGSRRARAAVRRWPSRRSRTTLQGRRVGRPQRDSAKRPSATTMIRSSAPN